MKKKSSLIIAAVLVAVVAVLGCLWFFTREEAVEGSKAIDVQLIYDDVDRTVTIHTDEEYLSGALKQEDLVEGEDGPYGLYVHGVDGRTADESKQEWWCVTRDGGQMVDTGMDTTVIKDGDKFEITLKTGW